MNNKLANLKGEAWLKEFLAFCSKPLTKQDVIDSLGTLRNDPEAIQLTLKPFNPYVDSVEVFTEDDSVRHIKCFLKPDFALSLKQIAEQFPKHQLIQNRDNMENFLTCQAIGPYLTELTATAAIGDDLSKPVRELGVRLG